jgi:hypothetical protein
MVLLLLCIGTPVAALRSQGLAGVRNTFVDVLPGLAPVASEPAHVEAELTAFAVAITTSTQVPTATVVPPKLEFTSTASRTIVEGDYVVLSWEAIEVDEVLLNNQPVTDTKQVVRPHHTTTYTLTGKSKTDPTQTISSTKQTIITVLKRVVVNFATFPNGVPVPIAECVNKSETKWLN